MRRGGEEERGGVELAIDKLAVLEAEGILEELPEGEVSLKSAAKVMNERRLGSRHFAALFLPILTSYGRGLSGSVILISSNVSIRAACATVRLLTEISFDGSCMW